MSCCSHTFFFSCLVPLLEISSCPVSSAVQAISRVPESDFFLLWIMVGQRYYKCMESLSFKVSHSTSNTCPWSSRDSLLSDVFPTASSYRKKFLVHFFSMAIFVKPVSPRPSCLLDLGGLLGHNSCSHFLGFLKIIYLLPCISKSLLQFL